MMSDYYWEQSARETRADERFEKNEKLKTEIAERHRKIEEGEKAEKQKAHDERFIRVPNDIEVLTDCQTCGRYEPFGYHVYNGIAKAEYQPTCQMCGEDVPLILGANIRKFVVEKIDYDDEGY